MPSSSGLHSNGINGSAFPIFSVSNEEVSKVIAQWARSGGLDEKSQIRIWMKPLLDPSEFPRIAILMLLRAKESKERYFGSLGTSPTSALLSKPSLTGGSGINTSSVGVCKPVGFSLSIDPIIAEGSETASFSLK
jgi:hypothetical protein